ncbi:MAG: biotin/lipoyl-binding protein [Thermoguttaceae bacterium]|nr:biotin/lipoyl-binding protein [Thermoguttaceae bacterium]
MVTLADSLVSSSERILGFYARADLTAKREQYLGRSYWIVKDPIGLKYFRFQDEEYYILNQLDGTRSLDTIKDNFEAEFPPQKITLDELQSFIGQLHQSNLIVAAVPNQGHELLIRWNKRRRQEIIQACSNILCIRFKGFDPNRILDAMLPWVRWCFHPVTLFFCFVLMFSALSLVIMEFDTFRAKLPNFHQFFGLKNIFLLTITLGCTKVIHEFGHGLSCKYFGGECHEIGIMILVLTPCLYCNVSDSWMLPNKWHRAAIGLAGMFVECVLASIATFIWWNTNEGLVHYLALNVMFISSVSTIIFNINPLLRYDGYYILSDILEIPNLRQKATQILASKSSHWFLGMEEQENPFLPQRNQFLFALYTIGAVMYRWVVMASILFFVYKFFDSYGLKIVGQMIGAMSLFGLVGMPLWKIGKFFWVPGRIYRVKKLNFYLSLTGLLLIVAFLIFVPFPYSVYAPCVIDLRSEATIAGNVLIPKTGGELVSVDVAEGQFVKKGDKLAELRNPVLEQDLIRLRGEYRETQMQFETYANLIEDSRAAAQRQELSERMKALSMMIAAREKEWSQLTLTAPVDGVVVSPEWRIEQAEKGDAFSSNLPSWHGTPLRPENMGVFLEPGVHFCSIGDPKQLEAVLVVDQSKINFIQKDQTVKIKLEELPGNTLTSRVDQTIDIEHHKMESVPIQLSTKGGGAVPTTSEQGGLEVPQSPSFRVRVDLENNDDLIKVGMTGKAKVKVAPQTILQRFIRLALDVFNFKLN